MENGYSLGYSQKVVVFHPARNTVWAYWRKTAHIGWGLLEMEHYSFVFNTRTLFPPLQLLRANPKLQTLPLRKLILVFAVLWIGKLLRAVGGGFYWSLARLRTRLSGL